MVNKHIFRTKYVESSRLKLNNELFNFSARTTDKTFCDFITAFMLKDSSNSCEFG